MKSVEYKEEVNKKSGKSNNLVQRVRVRKTYNNEPCPCGKMIGPFPAKFKNCCKTF